MKAYVIKNKEGKYRDKNGWLSEEFLNVDIFKDYELALSCCFSDEEPVEIIIAEGDLESQLAEKNKEIANIRQQVCEEIKEKLSGFCGYDLDNGQWVITEEMFKYLIDKIEKGEKE